MRFFSLTGVIVFLLAYTLIFAFVVLGLFGSLIMVYTGVNIGVIFSLGPIIYVMVYVWKWNKGEAKFP